jgi:hypothetical protein
MKHQAQKLHYTTHGMGEETRVFLIYNMRSCMGVPE